MVTVFFYRNVGGSDAVNVLLLFTFTSLTIIGESKLEFWTFFENAKPINSPLFFKWAETLQHLCLTNKIWARRRTSQMHGNTECSTPWWNRKKIGRNNFLVLYALDHWHRQEKTNNFEISRKFSKDAKKRLINWLFVIYWFIDLITTPIEAFCNHVHALSEPMVIMIKVNEFEQQF